MFATTPGTAPQPVQSPAASGRDTPSRRGPTKSAAPANALRHGLTATKLLPAVLCSDRLAEIKASLRAQYQPSAATQELFICEAARHLAMLEVVEEAEPAVLRQAALAFSLTQSDGATNADLMLAAAVSTEPLERVARYRRSHELAVYRALERLEQSQAADRTAATALTASRNDPTSSLSGCRTDRATAESTAAATSDPFGTEQQCEAYLRRRFAEPDWVCPRCRGARGHWLVTRKAWECQGCGAQTGLRSGTLFARSPLPLTTWFVALRAYLGNARLTAGKLAEISGIKRLATTRGMLARMRAAIDGDDPNGQFAGLLSKAVPGSRRPTVKRPTLPNETSANATRL